jgi:ATP-binding cassette subfamily B protein
VGDKPTRPEDPEVRRANLHRVFRLFGPERSRLSLVLALIVFSSALGMVPAFLLRDIIDQAIPEANTTLLAWLAGGMIVIAIIVGILGVAQTYLSNRVGQEVMHDLRSDVYEHLQRQSLAFFTRTRTGEVQSRIANDIGGVDDVVTSTATSVVSNVTTVLAAVVAMFLLDWRLAIFSLILVPFFVLLTRRVGVERRKLATERQKTLADISSLVQESLSVSGVLLGKTMGRGPELAERFRTESRCASGWQVAG